MWLKRSQHCTQDKEICEACSNTKSFNPSSSTCVELNLPATVKENLVPCGSITGRFHCIIPPSTKGY